MTHERRWESFLNYGACARLLEIRIFNQRLQLFLCADSDIRVTLCYFTLFVKTFVRLVLRFLANSVAFRKRDRFGLAYIKSERPERPLRECSVRERRNWFTAGSQNFIQYWVALSRWFIFNSHVKCIFQLMCLCWRWWRKRDYVAHGFAEIKLWRAWYSRDILFTM